MHPTHTPPGQTGITPDEVLHCAALYLYRHGWHQGDMFNLAHLDGPTPPACVQGAVKMVVCGGTDADYTLAQAALFHRSMAVLADYLYTTGQVNDPDPYGVDAADAVTGWNDAHSRTATEVITTLDAAADEWTTHHTTPGGGA